MAFGLALKSASWALRLIEFACAAVILGIFSYYLATLHNHNLHINTHIRAVEGIAGAAILYTVFALGLVCCLGGIALFSILGMLFDLAFTGAFCYIAWVNRHATDSCSGVVTTPFGTGDTRITNSVDQGSSGFTVLPSLKTACRLQKAAFAVAIIGLVFFFLSIFVEFLLMRHRRKERAFGPSPNNGYTAGTPRRKFWQRKPKTASYADKHGDALPTHATPADMRTSYATDTTAVGSAEPPVSKYGHPAAGAYGNQSAGVVGSGGYQTTTQTHVPGGEGPYGDGYMRSHQAYNQNPTGTF